MLKISTRFSVGVHILALLEICRDLPCASEFIAGSVGANPAVIRRLLGMLKAAGLVHTSAGVPGAKLAKTPETIRLLDVYRAVGAVDGTLFGVHERPNPLCPVGARIRTVLDETERAAQTAMERELASRTLADVVAEIRRLNEQK